jgi:hypothetical protein
MIIVTRQLTSKIAPLILAVLVAGTEARGNIMITIEQSGSNVVETGTGSVSTTGLTYFKSLEWVAQIYSPAAIAIVGNGSQVSDDTYFGVNGPANFGSNAGPGVQPTTGSGSTFGIYGQTEIALPSGYESGTQLSGSSTFDDTDFTKLGLTAGTYTYTWGTGGPDHTLTVQIVPAAAAVPEPSTLVGASIAVFLGLGCAWRRRKAKHAA